VTDLDARYGRTAGSAKRTRWIAVTVGILFALVFAAWLWWGGLLEAPAQFEARDVDPVTTTKPIDFFPA